MVLMGISAMGPAVPEDELYRRLTTAVTRSDPTWREELSLLREGVAQPYSMKRWRRGEIDFTVRHYPHESEAEATERARRLAEKSAVGFRPIKGHGDEAYLVDSPSSLSIALILRRGTTVISMTSRDRDAVLNLGTLFLREIDKARGEGIAR